MREIWKDVIRYEGIYEVSNKGRVRAKERVFIQRNGSIKHRRARILQTKVAGFYPEVSLCVDYAIEKRRVHDLVAESFLGPRPKGMYVCHNDGTMDNNNLDNLRYDTPAGNSADKIKHGTRNYVLNETKVMAILKLRGAMNYNEIADKFRVHKSTIHRIMRGQNWSHVSCR